MIFSKRSKIEPPNLGSITVQQSPEMVSLHALGQQQQHLQQLQQQTHRQYLQQQQTLMLVHTGLMIGIMLNTEHTTIGVWVCLGGILLGLHQFSMHLQAREQYHHFQQQLTTLYHHVQQYIQKPPRQAGQRYAPSIQKPASPMLSTLQDMEEKGAWPEYFAVFSWIWIGLWLVAALSFVHVPWGLPTPSWL
jgi:hypothetical protein